MGKYFASNMALSWNFLPNVGGAKLKLMLHHQDVWTTWNENSAVHHLALEVKMILHLELKMKIILHHLESLNSPPNLCTYFQVRPT